MLFVVFLVRDMRERDAFWGASLCSRCEGWACACSVSASVDRYSLQVARIVHKLYGIGGSESDISSRERVHEG